MILVTFTHGIGDFNGEASQQATFLGDMQRLFSTAFPDTKVAFRFLPYEAYMDQRLQSQVLTLAARLAAAKYAGTPALGDMLADYGGDIMAYYLRKQVRADISRMLAHRLAVYVNSGDYDRVIMIGHSLGSLAVLRLLALIQAGPLPGASITRTPLVEELIGRNGAPLFKDLRDIVSDGPILGGRRIHTVLAGSPAFSRVLKGVRFATHKAALAESPISNIVANNNGLPIINLFSDSVFKDPLAGPAGEGFLDLPVKDAFHHDVGAHLRTLLQSELASNILGATPLSNVT